jgi:hypothetical protein
MRLPRLLSDRAGGDRGSTVRQPPSDLVPLLQPTVERVQRTEGTDFLRELAHLVVEEWLRNARVAPFVREMIIESARRRREFLRRLRREQRETLAVVKEAMLSEHPKLGDSQQFPQIRGRPHADYSPSRFDELLARDDLSREEYAPAVWHPLDPYDQERSVEGYLLAILIEWERELRKRNRNWGKEGRSRQLEQWLQETRGVYEVIVRGYVDWRLVAPEVAMLDLCVGLQGLNWSPELAELGLDREDVLEAAFRARISKPLYMLLYEPGNLGSEARESAMEEIGVLKRRLERAWDGLRVRFASTLAAQTVVERFKTRVEEYDRQRTREIADREIARVKAEKAKGKRSKEQLEDVLTRDLNLYLYDEGYRVLYRPRYDDLEPDTLSLGPRQLLVEAKAYRKSSSARAEIREGFAQCVSYLSLLSSSAAGGLYEAHLAIFRLGGPLYKLPKVFVHGDFRIYPVLIDLADPNERGRNQARAKILDIPEEEIRKHVAQHSRDEDED